MQRRLPDRTSRVLLAGLALGAVVAGNALATGAAAANAAPAAPAAPNFVAPLPVSHAGGLLTRSAHVAFEGCSAKNITLSVSIARDPFLIGQPVTYRVTIRNNGATPCGPALASIPAPGQGTLTVGPCGQVSSTVVNASGLNVYPGREVFQCPMLFNAHLGAHALLTGQATWMGAEAFSDGTHGNFRLQEAPPGRYRVIVDNAVSVPFELAGPPPGSTPVSPAHPSSPIIPAPRTPGDATLPTPTTPVG